MSTQRPSLSDPVLASSTREGVAVDILRDELRQAADFLAAVCPPDGRKEEVEWTSDDAPPAALASDGKVQRDVVRTRTAVVDGSVLALDWAEDAGYTEVSRFNVLAHRPRRVGGGGNHIVARGTGVNLRVEVSTYSGETLIRSEVERLLRRLEVPRTNDDKPWPAERLCIVVPKTIADAIFAKARPRRCSYWVCHTGPNHSMFEVLPVVRRVPGGAALPLPGFDDPPLRRLLEERGAVFGHDGSHPTLAWPEAVDDELVTPLFEERDNFRTVAPDGSDATSWDEYWRFRALSPSVRGDLTPMIESVFLRYLLRLSRPEVVERSARILCVGNGLSLLPHALAALGFAVTAMDISKQALQINEAISPDLAQLEPMLGLAGDDQGASPGSLMRPDGSVVWVEGDLFDVGACLGLYDIIVAARVLEGMSDFDIQVATSRLEARLAPDGWCWVAVQNSGFKWITVQRAFESAGVATVPYGRLPPHGKAMAGGLTSGTS